MSHFDLASASLPGVIAQSIFLQINKSINTCHSAVWRLQSTILSAQDKGRKWGTREWKGSLQTCVCWSLHLAYGSSGVRGGERDRGEKRKQRGRVTEKEKHKARRDKCRGQSLNTNRTKIEIFWAPCASDTFIIRHSAVITSLHRRKHMITW